MRRRRPKSIACSKRWWSPWLCLALAPLTCLFSGFRPEVVSANPPDTALVRPDTIAVYVVRPDVNESERQKIRALEAGLFLVLDELLERDLNVVVLRVPRSRRDEGERFKQFLRDHEVDYCLTGRYRFREGDGCVMSWELTGTHGTTAHSHGTQPLRMSYDGGYQAAADTLDAFVLAKLPVLARQTKTSVVFPSCFTPDNPGNSVLATLQKFLPVEVASKLGGEGSDDGRSYEVASMTLHEVRAHCVQSSTTILDFKGADLIIEGRFGMESGGERVGFKLYYYRIERGVRIALPSRPGYSYKADVSVNSKLFEELAKDISAELEDILADR